MLDSIKEGYAKLKENVVEGVMLAEKIADMDGAKKREFVIKYVDEMIKLPEPWESILNVDGIIIGIVVDKAVSTLNSLGMGNITNGSQLQRVAAVLDAPHKALASPALQDLSIDDRINSLFAQYGIAKVAEESGIIAPTVKPVPTIKEPGHQTEAENWAKCSALVLASEGGFVDHPADKGGPTNMGITLGTLATAVTKGVVPSNQSLKTLTKEQASKIYHELYWVPSVSDEIQWAVCYMFYDSFVNGGLGMASRVFQGALNKTYDSKLDVDGKWGPNTYAEITKRFGLDVVVESDKVGKFVEQYLLERKYYYDRIIARTPSQSVFRNGWYNRLRHIAKSTGYPVPKELS